MTIENKYVCAICGKTYSTIEERAKCELTCFQKEQEEIKKAAELKKKEEKEAREKEITDLTEQLVKLFQKFSEDYGYYPFITAKVPSIDPLGLRIWDFI